MYVWEGEDRVNLVSHVLQGAKAEDSLVSFFEEIHFLSEKIVKKHPFLSRSSSHLSLHFIQNIVHFRDEDAVSHVLCKEREKEKNIKTHPYIIIHKRTHI